MAARPLVSAMAASRLVLCITQIFELLPRLHTATFLKLELVNGWRSVWYVVLCLMSL